MEKNDDFGHFLRNDLRGEANFDKVYGFFSFAGLENVAILGTI